MGFPANPSRLPALSPSSLSFPSWPLLNDQLLQEYLWTGVSAVTLRSITLWLGALLSDSHKDGWGWGSPRRGACIYRTGPFLSFLELSVNTATAIFSKIPSGRLRMEAPQCSRGKGQSCGSQGTKGLLPSMGQTRGAQVHGRGCSRRTVTPSAPWGCSQRHLPGVT